MSTQVGAAEIGLGVKAFMLRLAAHIRDAFPHHAAALNGELNGTRLTVDRWNRIAAVLASLHAVPGTELTPDQHIRRNLALAAIHVASRMAGGLLGAHHSERFLDFAEWRSRELEAEIK